MYSHLSAATVAVCVLFGVICYLSVTQDLHLVAHLKQHAGTISRPFLQIDALEDTRSFELDRRRLLPELKAKCPLVYQRPTMEELRTRQVRPYVFGGQQRPSCKNCHSVRDRGRVEFCAYTPHSYSPICPHKDQESLLQYFLERADNGSTWAQGLLQLTPCDLWPFIRGRTLWLMGDSITQEFMVAMECLFFEWYEDMGWGVGRGYGRFDVSNNTEALEIITKEGGVQPWCIPLPEGSRICHIRSNMGLDWADNVLPNLPRIGVRNTDILVGNFAVWINNDTEYAVNLGRVADYIRSAPGRLPYIIWRDASVQHFQTHTGDYNGAGYPFHCQPIGNETDAVNLDINGNLSTDDPELEVVVEGGWRNRIAYPIIESLNIPIMRTWNQTVPLWNFHHHYNMKCGNQVQGCPDCTHTCHPGYYQVWIYHLYETLMASQLQIWQHMFAAESQFQFPQAAQNNAL
ncbi:hypothetical protein COCOBI_03-0850 [Coccomyxa sp. Obi]|nr:hypothetical protein COCOBI_03-0850 [Coccomyxa sp. Obi]